MVGFLFLLALLLALAVGVYLTQRRPATPQAPAEPRIVASVMTAAAHKSVPVAHAIEQAMAQAVHDCIARGVSLDDSDTIRAAMQAARARVLGR